MHRALSLAVLPLTFACGFDVAESGDFYTDSPFYGPLGRVTVADAPAAGASETAPVPDAGSPGPSADSGVAPNVAQQVWRAQEDVWRSSTKLKEDYADTAYGWLKVASTTAGRQVTTGTLTEYAEGVYRYAPGGSTLRLEAKSGWRGELRVDVLEGTLTATGFPRQGEKLDVSWLVAGEGAVRCVLEYRLTRVSGRAQHTDGSIVLAAVELRKKTEVFSGTNPTTGLTLTQASTDETASGEVSWPGVRTVRYHTNRSAWTCIGSCISVPSATDFRQHRTSVEFHSTNQKWELTYDDGHQRPLNSSVPGYLWRGTITGPAAGTLVSVPSGGVFALDVVIGSDRYTVQRVPAVL